MSPIAEQHSYHFPPRLWRQSLITLGATTRCIPCLSLSLHNMWKQAPLGVSDAALHVPAGQPGTVLQAMLPILCMGRVSARLDRPYEPLTLLTRCLRKQPDGVSHLKLYSSSMQKLRSIRKLIDLRCAHAVQECRRGGVCMCLPSLCQCLHSQRTGWGPMLMVLCADAVCCQTCTRCPWSTLLSSCRRCSRSPRGCRVWK